MLIGAWIAPPHKIEGIQENFNVLYQYKMIKEVGINTIYGLYENPENHNEQVDKAIELSNEVGINYFVRDPRLKDISDVKDIKKISNVYMKKGAAGVLVADEPGTIDFNELSKGYNCFHEIYKQKMYYVNLLPIYANANQFLMGAWYQEETQSKLDANAYYEAYVKELKLPYLSYDFYPFEGEFPNVRNDYFTQLEMIREITDREEIIPICFIQVNAFGPHIRIPTFKEILWQVNTSIAYGTKGIQYFTYFLPINNEFEKFRGSIIDHYGLKTKLFDEVKTINQWINQISPLIIDSKLIEVTKEDEQLLVSRFVGHHVEFKLLTNLSLENVYTSKNFNQEAIKEIITMNKQINKNEMILQPGEAVIIIYKEEKI